MKRIIATALMILLLVGILVPSLLISEPKYNADSVDGYWRQVDDETDEERAIVKIYTEKRKNGEKAKSGRLVWTVTPKDENGDYYMVKGKLKGQPILGFRLLWGCKFNQKLANRKRNPVFHWEWGKIYDPEKGAEYGCQLELKTIGGKEGKWKYKADDLAVRGYGFLGINRAQYWKRATMEHLKALDKKNYTDDARKDIFGK